MSDSFDYVVSRKRSSSDGSKITHLEVRQDLGSRLGDPFIKSKSEVISMIEGGYDFCTIYRNQSDTQWIRGEKIHVVTTHSGKFN